MSTLDLTATYAIESGYTYKGYLQMVIWEPISEEEYNAAAMEFAKQIADLDSAPAKPYWYAK